MHACDIIAWHFNGAAYCPDCKPEHNGHGDKPSPVFADALEDENGATCDACGYCLVDGEWRSHEDATDDRYTRWTRCDDCNAQEPHDTLHGGSAYKRLRRLTTQGLISCRCCGRKGTLRWL